MSNKGQSLLEFGSFRVDTAQRLLFSGAQLVPLPPKTFDTLQVLIEADGRIVEKEELLKKVWPDTFVEEGSLARNISMLRKVLGESPDDQKYIQTIPKRGYRFIASVRVASDGNGAVVVEEHTQFQAAFDIETESEIETARNAARPVPRRSHASAMAAMGLALAVTAGIVAWRVGVFGASPSRPGTKPPSIHSLAVLPLENLSRDPAQEYFSDGMTDALITSLAQVEALQVISRTSAMRYKKTAKSAPEIARELGVDAILEGSVQREGTRVRISAQLVQAATDTHLWAKDYQFDLSNLLQVEGEVARTIAHEIQSRVTPLASQSLARNRLISPAAQDLYMQGSYYEQRRDETNVALAIGRYERAIALQPDFTAAYVGLARAWIERGVWGRIGFRQSEAPARQAALKALELDPESAEAHTAIGHVSFFYDLAWETAEREFRLAIERDPNCVYAHRIFGGLLEALGRFPAAIQEEERAIALDPLSSLLESEYARILFRARKFDESILHFQRAIELDPQDFGAYTRLGEVYEQAGKFQEAVGLIEKACRMRGDAPMSTPSLGRAYALAGRRSEAREVLSHVAMGSARDTSGVALMYFALGDRDRGFEWLTKAFDERQLVVLVKFDPRFDSVRDDPRFEALVRRLGLPENQ